MLTWKLWRALFRPPITHPLYQRVTRAASLPTPPFADAIETIASLLVLPVIAFTGAVHGVGWALAISCVIAAERRHYTYDLLGSMAGGMLDTSWLICTACLHRHRKFINISSMNALMGRLVIISIVFLAFIPTWVEQGTEGVTVYLMYMLSVLAAMVFDHSQAIVTSCLVGMLVPHLKMTRTEPALGALFACLLLQVTTYLVIALTIFLILPTLYIAIDVHGFIADISIPLLGLVEFVLLREFIIRRLWTELLKHVNADFSEFSAVLRQKA